MWIRSCEHYPHTCWANVSSQVVHSSVQAALHSKVSEAFDAARRYAFCQIIGDPTEAVTSDPRTDDDLETDFYIPPLHGLWSHRVQ